MLGSNSEIGQGKEYLQEQVGEGQQSGIAGISEWSSQTHNQTEILKSKMTIIKICGTTIKLNTN